ncbi:MAG: protease HtpX [Myxococcota bacterium]
MKSAALLIGTNLAVMAVLGAIFAGLQVAGVLPPMGAGQTLPLILMAGVFGFGGAAASLFMSKSLAKRRLRMITAPQSEMEQWLVTTVARQAQAAGIKMPEVGIENAPHMNAFATGPSKNNSLVAVTTGLMQGMTRDEVEAVLAHEVSHAANGDMVSMTLVQGVVNTFVIVFAQLLGTVIDNMLSGGRSRRRGIGFTLGYMIAQTVLGFLATIIVRWFSRYREFRADAGAAKLSSAPKMIAALERLRSQTPPPADARAVLGIHGGIRSLFATHPPLEKRIDALRG